MPGGEGINWYADPKWWPLIFVVLNVWKSLGYNSIIYYASVMGIDPTYYEAAMVDGASKWQQIKNVTIPQLIPMMTVASNHEHRRDIPSRFRFVLPSTEKLRCLVPSYLGIGYVHL